MIVFLTVSWISFSSVVFCVNQVLVNVRFVVIDWIWILFYALCVVLYFIFILFYLVHIAINWLWVFVYALNVSINGSVDQFDVLLVVENSVLIPIIDFHIINSVLVFFDVCHVLVYHSFLLIKLILIFPDHHLIWYDLISKVIDVSLICVQFILVVSNHRFVLAHSI